MGEFGFIMLYAFDDLRLECFSFCYVCIYILFEFSLMFGITFPFFFVIYF